MGMWVRSYRTLGDELHYCVAAAQRMTNRRRYFENDFLASDVVLTDAQSAIVDQICETYIGLGDSTALGVLVRLGPTDCAAVANLMWIYPKRKTSPITETEHFNEHEAKKQWDSSRG